MEGQAIDSKAGQPAHAALSLAVSRRNAAWPPAATTAALRCGLSLAVLVSAVAAPITVRSLSLDSRSTKAGMLPALVPLAASLVCTKRGSASAAASCCTWLPEPSMASSGGTAPAATSASQAAGPPDITIA